MDWVSLEKGKVEEWKEEKSQSRRDEAAAVRRNRQRQSSVAKGRQGVVVMSIAEQSGVAGCRGRADGLRVCGDDVHLSASARKTVYHGKRLR